MRSRTGRGGPGPCSRLGSRSRGVRSVHVPQNASHCWWAVGQADRRSLPTIRQNPRCRTRASSVRARAASHDSGPRRRAASRIGPGPGDRSGARQTSRDAERRQSALPAVSAPATSSADAPQEQTPDARATIHADDSRRFGQAGTERTGQLSPRRGSTSISAPNVAMSSRRGWPPRPGPPIARCGSPSARDPKSASVPTRSMNETVHGRSRRFDHALDTHDACGYGLRGRRL